MRNAVSAPDAGKAAATSGRQWILWIDDQPDEAGLLRLLGSEGFRVTPASTGKAALELANHHPYDAIVVDLHLPDVHGFVVIERLRGSGISCPIVAVTGHYLDPEAPDHAREAGATAFEYKPLWLDETAELLRDLVARHAADGGTHAAGARRCSGAATDDQPRSDRADPAEMVLRRLSVHLDCIASTPPLRSGHGRRDALLDALLSALAEPALPLAGVHACAQALRTVLSAPPGAEAASIATAHEVVRQAMRQPLTPRHPTVRQALTVLHQNPRWWEEEELARDVGATRGHFSRIVHQDLKLEYRALRRLVVMKAGVVDVLSTNEHIAQIAHRLGIAPGTFDELFANGFGSSPSDLRRLWTRLRY
jgi:CheY-like chemotaxis protein